MSVYFNKNSDSNLILSGQFSRVCEIAQLRISDKPRSGSKLNFLFYHLQIVNLPEVQFYQWSHRLVKEVHPTPHTQVSST